RGGTGYSGPTPRSEKLRRSQNSDFRRHDVDRLAATLLAELDRAGGPGEQRVVAATADVHAGVELGATLADQDLARVDFLAAVALDAEALRVRVTTVAGAGRTLLVSHSSILFLKRRSGEALTGRWR